MSALLWGATSPKICANLFILFLLLVSYAKPQLGEMSDNTVELSKKFAHNLGEFSMEMYSQLLKSNPEENIIFSPLSIQTCVAMARLGADGETAKELDRGLHLVSGDVTTIAESFGTFLEEAEKSKILNIANKIYVMSGFTILKEYNDLVSKKFFTVAESIDFSQSAQAASTMNGWVESKTNNLIKELISPSALGADTRLVLLNAIHFKGQWKHKFPEHRTREENFYLNNEDTVKVPMMQIKERFRYADLPEFDATALEMPYKESDLSMMVILPNSRTGLKNLEEKLKGVTLSDITGKMYSTQVIVKLPKFKAEFSVLLNDQLQKLGMSRMFSGNAEFGKMLDSTESLAVSKVIHKAFIQVDEEGTEAAAATEVKMRAKRSVTHGPDPKEFIAEHPFLYVINKALPAAANIGGENKQIKNSLFMGVLRRPKVDSNSEMHDEL